MTNIQSQIANIQSQLESAYPQDEAHALAWWVAEELTGLTRSQIITGCKGTTNFSNLQEIIDRLLHFEPIQYIFGHTLWCGLDLKVTPATLIPRPETAELVERVQNTEYRTQDNAPLRVLDIGTGSGCIAISLKKAHPEWEVTGIDISEEAIEVARENAKRNGVEVSFKVADIFDFNEEIFTFHFSPFNLIVSNPPYICEREKESMRPNVLAYEPASALFVPDDDPLLFYRRIAKLCSNHQSPLFLFFEISEYFSDEMEHLLQEEGYTNIRIHRDMYGKPRVAEGTLLPLN